MHLSAASAILSPVDWAAIARAQDGMISRAQLRKAGLDDAAVRRLADSRALDRHAQGVYLVRGAPLTYRAALWRALLATDGVLGFGTAAHLWGMTDDVPGRVNIVVPPSRHITVPWGVRVHRAFVPRSAVVVHDGLPMTSRTWTLLDHLGRLPWAAASQLADRAMQRSWMRSDDIQRRLSQYPGRQGNATLRRLAGQLEDGAAAKSERLLHRLLRAGICDWTPNCPVWVDGELIAVVDVAIPSARLAIEIDGMAYHTDAERFQRDRSRQNTLVGLGWTVLRFTWSDLTERPGDVIATIQRHLARAS
jgi:predicted transcriptional regulator of viral defense system